jgi:tetratricopeptide (TPR) repeat protein
MGIEDGSGRRFVGRGETVELLQRRFEEARAGVGGVTLVVGETGVGKTTLVDHLLGGFRSRGVRTLIGRAVPVDDPPPYSLLQSAFDSLGPETELGSGPESPETNATFRIGSDPSLAPGSAPATARYEERLLELLGAAGEQGTLSRELVLARIGDRFAEFTREGPTVLLLDGIARADDSSLTAVESVAERLRAQPLWILATSRPAASLSEAGRARLQKFESATHAEQLPLRPLTTGEVADYLKAHDRSREFSPDEVARRHAATGGNPLRLSQLDRRMAAGAPPPTPAGTPRPPLDKEAQRLLDVAAVLGPEFSFDLLLGASGEEAGRLSKVVDRLVERGLLFERPGDLLEFPQDRLREEAYRHLTDGNRRVIHRRAGVAREAMDTPGPSRVFGLARDFYLGKEERKSVEYNRIAAQIAVGAMAPEVAREFLAHALESQRSLDPDDIAAESELVLELGRVTYEVGRLEESERVLRDFLDQGKNDPRVAPLLVATLEICLCQVLTARGDLGGARILAETVLSAPGLESEPLIRIGAHHQLGLAAYYDGHFPEALVHHTEEMRLARGAGNERVIAHAQIWRSGVLAMMGEGEQAIVGAREVAATLDRSGSVGESAQGHLFLGNMLADAKPSSRHRTEAILELGKAIRLGEEAHDPRRVGWALCHTAELLRQEGRWTESTERAQRAVEILAQIGDRVGQSVAMKVRGQVAMARGDYDLAQADFVDAYRDLHGLNNTLYEIDVVLRLAQLASVRGDPARALGHVAELERLKLATARPDLVEEFELLRSTIAGSSAQQHSDAPPPPT